MPDLTFILPHWIYWAGLILVPLCSMFIIHRQRGVRMEGKISLGIAYMFWFMSGFAGVHRLYLKNKGALVYFPLIIAVLLTNVEVKEALNQVSGAKNHISIAEFELHRARTALKLEDTEETKAKVKKAEQDLRAAQEELRVQLAKQKKWMWVSRILAIVIAVLLVIDAFLIPGMVRRTAAAEQVKAEPVQKYEIPDAEEFTTEVDPASRIRTPWLDWIDSLNGFVGEFVCYWSIIAVFVYYYEVIARYIFNSPTNWAHEGMFLMFGMQYMLAAGYTERERGHVYVDIVHKLFPDRIKAVVDIFASSLFFLFTVAILVTGWIFLKDALRVWEVSFTEWAIHYWPVKITIPLGALLITLQGFSKLVKDIIILVGKRV
ncbi:MAG: TRAP transporter small permease subunit [Deltaproteobacteria bacterium]|nr:TRAP transporter small permease subunit [Deltaproteobacteria bacterium]